MKRFAKRLVKTFILYQVMKKLDIHSPLGPNRVVKTSYKAMLKRIK